MRITNIITSTFLLLAFASQSPAGTVFDNCNDGDVDDRWQRDVNVIRVQERQGKLKFQSDDGLGGERFSGYDADRWDFDYTRNYAISFNYRLDVHDVTGSQYAAVGACLDPSGPIDEMLIQVRCDDDGLCVVYEAWRNGNRIERKRKPIDAVQGKMTARYRAAADRLDVFIDDNLVMRVRDFLDDNNVGDGSSRLDIGAGRRGPVTWSWSDVWMDNVRMSGQIMDDDDYDDDCDDDSDDDDMDDYDSDDDDSDGDDSDDDMDDDDDDNDDDMDDDDMDDDDSDSDDDMDDDDSDMV